MTPVDVLGYLAAFLVLATFSMRTMLPLRMTGIASNCAFLAYGYFSRAYPVMVLHAILLPLNTLRLYQMMQLIKQVREASRGDLSMDWLKPYMSNRRRCRAGEVIFRKGDAADQMFYTVSGRYRLNDLGAIIEPGHVVGEIGLVAPGSGRTLTLECVEDGELLSIGYGQVAQIFFQNPKFGFYLLQLISERLFRDIRRLEAMRAAMAAAPAAGEAPSTAAAAPFEPST